MPSRMLLCCLACWLGPACADDPNPQITTDSRRPADIYVYIADSPGRLDWTPVERGPRADAPADSTPRQDAPRSDLRKPDLSKPDLAKPDQKLVDQRPPDLNCTPPGGDKCTTPPTSCCGGLACCSCPCGKFCTWSATVSCQNVCINVC